MRKIFRNVCVCATIISVASCGSKTKKEETATEPSKPAINQDFMDKSVRPQDDFYNYVNGNWMKTTQIPADKASWGAFYELREMTDEQCLTILENLLKENQVAGSEGEKIKNIYDNFTNWKVRNENGLQPLATSLDKISAIASLADFQNYLNESTQNLENPFYNWSVYADMKDSKSNAIYLDKISLGLGRDYYQKDDAENAKTIAEYQKFVSSVLTKIGYKNADEVAAAIVAFEKQIAKTLLTNEEIRDTNKQYNLFTMPELTKLVKHINLPDYLEKVGVKTNVVIIPELNYYKQLDSFINQKNLSLLKDFLKYRLVANNASYLDEELDALNFNFYGKYLNGQQEQRPMNKRGLGMINEVIGEAFGKLYVEKYFSAKSKEEMITLVDYLRKSFEVHIKNLSWMSDITKEKALKKLSTFVVKVGYPDKWEDYSKMDIRSHQQGGSLYENLQSVARWNYAKALSEVGKPVDKTKWGMSPQTVNAYYNPLYNEIVFPAGILQPPFFNATADAAINFGGIGAVIGHEMTHGFDDSGALFDSEGNLSNWWSDEDKANFEKVTNALAEQYSAYEPVKGTFINGKFTNGENIADLGGAAISFDALQMYLKDKGQIAPIDGYTQNQRFFLSWATIWRTKSTDKYVINQVKTDPHSPGYFRAFAPLINIDAFYEAFDIKENDKHYKKPEDRIKIW